MKLTLFRTRLGVFLLSVLVVLLLVTMAFRFAGEDGSGVIADYGSPLFSSMAAILAFTLYWQNRKTPFKEIGLGFAIAYSLLASAEIIFSTYVEVFGIEPRVSIADVFWISGYLALVVLFARMIRQSGFESSRKMFVAQALYWAAILPILGYVTYNSFVTEGTDVLNMVTMAIYMYGDAVILSLLIAFLGSDVISELQEFRTIVSVSTTFIMGGDILYTIYESTVGYTVGAPPDVFFVSGYLVLTIGLALLVRARMRFSSLAPAKEAGSAARSKRRLEEKKTYVVLGDRPVKAYEMLLSELNGGREGLVVTQKNPEHIRTDYGLKLTPTIWLSSSPGNNVIHPANLGILTDTIVRAIEKQPDSVILIDGFENIVFYNDFQKGAQMLDHLKDRISLSRSTLIVAINRTTLSDKEAAIISRGSEMVST